MKKKILAGFLAVSAITALHFDSTAEAAAGDKIFSVEPVSAVTFTMPKTFTYQSGKDTYIVNYGVGMANQLIIKKNKKVVYKGEPIRGTVGNVELISIRGKNFWRVTSRGSDITKKEAAFLAEDNNDQKIRSYFYSGDYKAPEGYVFYEITSSKENHDRAKGNCYFIDGDYLTAAFIYNNSERFDDISVFYYILDYDKANDKFVYAEAGINKDYDAEVKQVHAMINEPDEASAAKKIIKNIDNCRLVYQEVNTGNAAADNAINNDILNNVNDVTAKAKEDGVIKVMTESTVTSENDKYISIISLTVVSKSGNKQEFFEEGAVYSKADGKRIPLSEIADVSQDFVAKKTFYRDMMYPSGNNYTEKILLNEAERISENYIISKNGKIILLYNSNELVPAKYGRPGINVTKCWKPNPYFTAVITKEDELTDNNIYDDMGDDE